MANNTTRNMHTLIADFSRAVKERGVFFDVEAGGTFAGQQMYSYSYKTYKGDIQTWYARDVNQSNWSHFSKKNYAKLTNIPDARKTNLSTQLASDFDSFFANNNILLFHNARYDIAASAEEMGSQSAKLYQGFRHLFGQDLDAPITDIVKSYTKTSSSDFRAGRYTRAYGSYLSSILSDVNNNRPAVADTLTMFQMAMGMAHENQYVNFGTELLNADGSPILDLNGKAKWSTPDVWSGTKQSLISHALGVTGFAHDEGDIAHTQKIFDFTQKSAAEFASGTPSEGTLNVFRRIREIQGDKEAGYAIDALHRSLAETAAYRIHAENKDYSIFGLSSAEEIKGKYVVGTEGRLTKGKPAFVDTVEDFLAQNTKFRKENALYTKYGVTNDYIKSTLEGYYNELKGMPNAESMWDFVHGIGAEEKYTSQVSKFTRTTPIDTEIASSFKEAMLGKKNMKRMAWIGGAVAAASLLAVLSQGYDAPPPQRISGKDDDYNTIEGLRHGGVAQQMRSDMTDFGSGYKGMKLSPNMIATLAGGGLGFLKGVIFDEDQGSFSSGLVGLGAQFIDDALIFGINAYVKRSNSTHPWLVKTKNVLSNPWVQLPLMFYGGYTVGEFIGSRIPGKDDAYNTIEGLRHGGVAQSIRREMTEFGSGYQGPNPDINPSYNTAKDVYKYQLMRASKIGLSEGEMYEYMTKEDNETTSEYVAASASAGTALHALVQAKEFQLGRAVNAEELVVNEKYGITGHIDIERSDIGIGDIKTVNAGRFRAVQKMGRPYQMHYDQLQFYLGQKGQRYGFVQYINRDNINQEKIYTVQFNPRHYENLLAKVERTRAKVEEEYSHNLIKRYLLPKTASIETLREYEEEHAMTPEDHVRELEERRRVFREEMAYLRSTKRGMPSSGQGFERVQNRNKQKIEAMMHSTQGIGLQAYENRNQHHQM